MRRPRNINILTLMRYQWPVTAIASILHRISGVVLFLLFPLLIYLLAVSVHSPAGFNLVSGFLCGAWCKFFLWATLSALTYHVIAGIKHLLMDCGWFETLFSGTLSSAIVIVLSFLIIILLGVWLW